MGLIVETVTTPDLPVLWWVFWLVVGVGIFLGLVWWLTRAALGEDRARSADRDAAHDDRRPEAT